MYKYKYERPLVTVDVVLLSLRQSEGSCLINDLDVLLIKRRNPPYKNCWALPGGFIDMKEELVESARREMAEETGINLAQKELHPFYVAGQPGRDPRGRVISVVYLALGRADKLRPKASDDAKKLNWFSMYNLPPLAFDHKLILNQALKELRQLALNVTGVTRLLPKKFSLTGLRQAYETIYARRFKAELFNRILLGAKTLMPVGQVRMPGKTIKLYSIKKERKKTKLNNVEILKLIHSY